MDDDSGNRLQLPKALSMFGVVAAAVVGITVQPMLAIANPVALLVSGFLIVVIVAGIVVELFKGYLLPGEELFFQFVQFAALISMVLTVGDAWVRQRSIARTCARLQHVMLYEHRHRTDVPDIFRTLGCKAQ